MADTTPIGGIQINELPESSTIQSTDKLVINRDGDDYSVTASQFSDKVEGTVSDAFDSTKAYSAGDYCIYNDVLYKFTSAKSAGSWSSSVVQAVTVADEISDLNADLTELNSDLIVVESFSLDNETINSYQGFNFDVSKNGYTPIGVVGFRTQNADSGGQNSSACCPYCCRLTATNNVYFAIRNVQYSSAGAAIVKLIIDVMYRKNA